MIKLSLGEIKAKIIGKTNISEQELDLKISTKLEQLSGLISSEGAAHIIANELGVKLIPNDIGLLKVKNIMAGLHSVEVIAKVIKKYEIREFKTETRSGKIGSFLIGDETGLIRVVLWNDMVIKLNEFKEGDIIKIKSAYARQNNDRVELHINDRSKITINPEGVSINLPKQNSDFVRKNIIELNSEMNNIEVLGHIVSLFDIKYFEVCPECATRTKPNDNGQFICPKHNIITPAYSYLLNFFLDDGTENIRCVCFRNGVLELLELSNDEILKFRENPDLFNSYKNILIGKLVLVKGNVKHNKLFERMEFNVLNINSKIDSTSELVKLDKAMEETI